MYRWQAFCFFLIGLAVESCLPQAGIAQDEPPVASPPLCLELFCKVGRIDPAPAPNERLEVRLRLVRPRKPPPPSYTYPFEQYHGRFHNDFLHPLVVTSITSYRDEHPPFFKHWNSSRKGFDLVQFGAGRFGLGVETQRVLVTEADRRSSTPFGPDHCYASGFQSTTACYAISFREGERRYGVSLRIYLNRPR